MKRERIASYIAVLTPISLLLVFTIYPVLTVMMSGLFLNPTSNPLDVLQSIVTQRIVAFTVSQAILSTALSVVLGLPGGFLLAKMDFRGKSLMRALVIVPFVLPPIVVVVGFLRMFTSYGLLDTLVMAITGSTTSVINLASGMTGIVLAHAFYNAPLVMLLVSTSLERLHPEVEESAEILGADHFAMLKRVILPHISPALASASLLVFLFCFMSFPIVLALGHGSYSTIEVQIWAAFNLPDYTRASTLAFLQLLVTSTVALAYFRLGRGTEYRGETSYVKTARFSELSMMAKILTLLYTFGMIVLVAGPVASIAYSSVYDPIGQEYTLRGFANLFVTGTGGGLLPLVNSLYYAVLATLFAIALGIPLAYAQKSRNPFVGGTGNLFTLIPLGVSSITIAYGLMQAIAVPLGLTTNPWPLIVIAQTIIGLPFSARAIEVSLRDIEPEVLDQADILGASRLEKFFFVEMPLLAPGILVGGAFAFAMAIGEMSATLFIAMPQNFTLAVAIYQNLGVRKFVEAGAAAFVLAAICVLAFLVIERVSGLEDRGAL